MKIIFHTHEFNLKSGGPCTKRILSFVDMLTEKGHEVTILTGSHNKKSNSKSISNKYKIIYSYTMALGKKKNLYRFIEQMSFAVSSFFVGIVKLKKADFLLTTSPPPFSSITGYFLGKIKKAQVIYDVRDIWPDVALEMGSFNEKSIYFKIFKFISNFMYKHADYITTVTPRKTKKLQKRCNKKSKVWYVANGFDDNFLNFKVDRGLVKKYGLKDKFNVVYTGNIGLAQNLDALLNLAKENLYNKNIQFLIFGDGAYKTQLQKRIEDERLENVFVYEKIEYSKIYTVMKYANISFVSLKNNKMLDSVPTKMFDALGVGCPVLLLAKGDSADILSETSLGENATNYEELVQKFNYIKNNYEEYTAKSKTAIKYVIDNYSRKKIAVEFERLLSEHVK